MTRLGIGAILLLELSTISDGALTLAEQRPGLVLGSVTQNGNGFQYVVHHPLPTPTSPQSANNSPFPLPCFVLALAGIRRLVVKIKPIEKDDLPPPPPSEGWSVNSS